MTITTAHGISAFTNTAAHETTVLGFPDSTVGDAMPSSVPLRSVI
jgi:hypothetical protein